ncbi:T-cell surface glycoprotein CD8 alpha chain [Ambystoma mexicanum]|uniref:T-cell surface glycoprotein CD8 alpha chain n=1 Tax=Ambystoma mexicanum TaxID=8296 RepID=UPI0037E72011
MQELERWGGNFRTGTEDSSQQKQIGLKLTTPYPKREHSLPLKLLCTLPDTDLQHHGVFWFRQIKNKITPQYLLQYGYKQKVAKGIDEKRFIANKESMAFNLEIKEFKEQDEGTYYCLINANYVLYFSSGLQLYYPPVTTPPPKLTTPQNVTVRAVDNCNCPTTLPTEKILTAESLDFPCSLYILVRMAAVGGVLLIAFLVASSLLCKIFIRRKRCKHHGKKRPMNENIPIPSR